MRAIMLLLILCLLAIPALISAQVNVNITLYGAANCSSSGGVLNLLAPNGVTITSTDTTYWFSEYAITATCTGNTWSLTAQFPLLVGISVQLGGNNFQCESTTLSRRPLSISANCLGTQPTTNLPTTTSTTSWSTTTSSPTSTASTTTSTPTQIISGGPPPPNSVNCSSGAIYFTGSQLSSSSTSGVSPITETWKNGTFSAPSSAAASYVVYQPSTFYCPSCPAGSSARPNSTYCPLCAPGTYSNTAGALFCNPCDAQTFSSSLGSTSCTTCSSLCASGNCPYPQAFMTYRVFGSTTCSFNGSTCLYDDSPIAPGTTRVSAISNGSSVSFNTSQPFGISGWFYMQSKTDAQVLFSIAPPPSSNTSAFTAGDLAVVLHPQDYYYAVELFATYANNTNIESLTFFGSSPLPLRMQNWNWFMLSYDPIAAQMLFTFNNATYALPLSSLPVYLAPLNANAVFTPGALNFPTPAVVAFQGATGPFRLYTSGYIPASFLQQGVVNSILPFPAVQAVHCPSDFFSCPPGQQLTMPPFVSLNAIPTCTCEPGYYENTTAAFPCIACPTNYFCDGITKTPCPPHLPLSNALSAISFQCYANATWQYITPYGLPNVDMAGRGYDLLNGNPMSMDGPDPGLRGKVFNLNYFDGIVSDDQRYIIPKGTTLYQDTSCFIDFTSQVITSSQSYIDTLYSAVDIASSLLLTSSESEGDGVVGGESVDASAFFAFQGSTEYQMIHEGTSSYQKVYTSTSAECSAYTVYLQLGKVPLHQDFLSFVRTNLADLAVDGASVTSLITLFGTHVPTKVSMGSRYGQVYELNSEYLQQKTENDLAVQASLQTAASANVATNEPAGTGSTNNGFAATFGLSTEYDSTSTQDSSFSSNITNSFTFSVGAALPASGNSNDWAAQTVANPAIIGLFDLATIDNVLTQTYFPDADPISLENARYYIFQTIIAPQRCITCKQPVLDYDVCFGGIVVDNVNTMTGTSGCPSNYILTNSFIMENNNWGLNSLQFCYHSLERCAQPVGASAPNATTNLTNSMSSFGGMFARFQYFFDKLDQMDRNDDSAGALPQNHQVFLLNYFFDNTTGNPYIDNIPVKSPNIGTDTSPDPAWAPGNWAHFDIRNSPILGGPWMGDHEDVNGGNAWNYHWQGGHGPQYYSFFDQVLVNTTLSTDKTQTYKSVYYKTHYQLKHAGNPLNNNSASCPSGFEEFFFGIFYHRAGYQLIHPSNHNEGDGFTNYHAHAALFICLAVAVKVDMDGNPLVQTPVDSRLFITNPTQSSPYVIPPAGPPYSAPSSAPSCGVPIQLIQKSDYKNHGPHDFLANPRHKGWQDDMDWQTDYPPLQCMTPYDLLQSSYDIKNQDTLMYAKSAYENAQVRVPGSYGPLPQASIGGVFARVSGDPAQSSFGAPLGSPLSATYVRASSNWLNDGLASCPPGYFESVLFTVNDVSVTGDAEAFSGSTNVIICLLTSRVLYQTSVLTPKSSASLAPNTQPFPQYAQPFLPSYTGPVWPGLVNITSSNSTKAVNATR